MAQIRAEECTVLGVSCGADDEDGPVTVIIVTLLTQDGDTYTLAFNRAETVNLLNGIAERLEASHHDDRDA